MAVEIKSGSSSTKANVDSNNNLQVNLPTVKESAGYSVLLGESHDGASGAAKLVRAAKVSVDGRLRTGNDSLYWQDTFNHTIQDTGSYQFVTATMTTALSGGYLVLNSGNSVASAAVARVQTYKTFPINAHASLDIGFRVRFSNTLQTNNAFELGLGFATTTTTPTDGVYFKASSGGELRGVININGSETTTAAFTAPTINQAYYLKIVLDQDRAEFYIDNVLVGVLDAPTTSPTVSYARALPLLMRCYNSAIVSVAQRVEISDISVLAKDLTLNRLLPTVQTTMCQSSVNVPRGATAGQTANYTNSVAPTSATLSNTAAGYTTLGGLFQFAAVVGAVTDYALFAYQVPLASSVGGNKNLIIRGVRIEAYNTGAASATTPTVLQWGLGLGSTAVSLATADSATAGTRAPRRIPLGLQSMPVATPIGGVINAIDVNLDAPLMVEAGTFVHIILRMPVATATASQVISGSVMFNAYWE